MRTIESCTKFISILIFNLGKCLLILALFMYLSEISGVIVLSVLLSISIFFEVFHDQMEQAVKDCSIVYAGEHFKFVTRDKKLILTSLVKTLSLPLSLVKILENDKEFVMEAIKNNMGVIEYSSEDLKDDKDFILKAVKVQGKVVQFTSKRLREDREIVIEAVSNDGLAIQFIDDELKDDMEVVRTAVMQNCSAFDFVKNRIQKKDFLLEMIELYKKTSKFFILEKIAYVDIEIQWIADKRNRLIRNVHNFNINFKF